MKYFHKKISVILIIILNLFNIISQGQNIDTLKCNIATIAEMDRSINQPNEKLMLKFLETFGDECKNNVEFSEFSNEILFKVIQRQTALFLKTLQMNLEIIDFEEITFNIENPIHDMIDLELTKEKILSLNSSGDVKTKLIDALDKAINKLK